MFSALRNLFGSSGRDEKFIELRENEYRAARNQGKGHQEALRSIMAVYFGDSDAATLMKEMHGCLFQYCHHAVLVSFYRDRPDVQFPPDIVSKERSLRSLCGCPDCSDCRLS